MPSFDVVSEINMHEVTNAVQQATKEMETRYDLRGSGSEILLEEESITLKAVDKMKLGALKDILLQKMSKRGVGLKSLVFSDPEASGGSTFRQSIKLLQGISSETAKIYSKLIKDQKMKKVQVQIQGDQLRVSAPKKDDLQAVISLLKEREEQELQFVNFRD